MTLIMIFMIVFVAGPLVLRLMTLGGPTPVRTRCLAAFAFGCAALALALRYGVADLWGDDLLMTIIGMTLIWIGWISVLAIGVLVLRRRDPGVFMWRATAVLGTAGTTIPWFGLAAASTMMT